MFSELLYVSKAGTTIVTPEGASHALAASRKESKFKSLSTSKSLPYTPLLR